MNGDLINFTTDKYAPNNLCLENAQVYSMFNTTDVSEPQKNIAAFNCLPQLDNQC